jgi:DNA-binding NarL/FixJ family response regulator
VTKAEGTSICVLIVDDHELVRVGLRELLESDPQIEVVGDAAAGATAIALARERRPDIVLLDARLPDLNGADVCRRLRAADPDIVVAMLTTFADDELVQACVRAGAQGYLLKDIDRLDLGRSIKALARGETVFDAKVAPLAGAVVPTDEPVDQLSALSARQREVLQLVAEGFSNREIAVRMSLSELTVKSYVEEILQQLGARNRAHAALIAMKRHWI